MADIFENTILCSNCNKKTVKKEVNKDGFIIRTVECPDCNKKWFHPADIQEYENFQKLKNKEFEVKLRLVGNSYTVSIPREIIDFEEEFQREIDDMIRMCLEEPRKLSLFFTRKRKIY